MNPITYPQVTAFDGPNQIASGPLDQVALQVREVGRRGSGAPLMIFDDQTQKTLEIDFRGSTTALRRHVEQQYGQSAHAAQEPPAPGPGRPRLGVVAREVTLLPRHWEWLAHQTGGASVALRKLVEEARRTNEGRDRQRQAQEVCYRFMSTMAGNQPGFEEATRALFAGYGPAFQRETQGWPADVREHAWQLAARTVSQGA